MGYQAMKLQTLLLDRMAAPFIQLPACFNSSLSLRPGVVPSPEKECITCGQSYMAIGFNCLYCFRIEIKCHDSITESSFKCTQPRLQKVAEGV